MKNFIFLFLLFPGVVFSQSMSSFIDGIIGNQGKFEGPKSIDIQGGKFYSGGGYSRRTSGSNYQPFYMAPPNTKAGCGGIDTVWGGFGYLDPTFLVSLGEEILQAAPAIAFDIALQTFCPVCEDIKNKLVELSNMVNSMNLDSCGLADTAGNAVSSWLGSEKNKALLSGIEQGWLNTGAKKVKGALEDGIARLGSSGIYTSIGSGGGESPKETDTGTLPYVLEFVGDDEEVSLLSYILRKSKKFSGIEPNEINLLRSFFGDVIKTGKVTTLEKVGQNLPLPSSPAKDYKLSGLEGRELKSSSKQVNSDDKDNADKGVQVESESGLAYRNISPIYLTEEEIKTLMSQLIFGQDAEGGFLNEKVSANARTDKEIKANVGWCRPGATGIDVIAINSGKKKNERVKYKGDPLCEQVRGSVDGIFSKIMAAATKDGREGRAGTFSPHEIKVMAMMPAPVYKILNLVSIDIGLLDELTQPFARVLISQYIYAYLSEALIVFKSGLSNFTVSSENKESPIGVEITRLTFDNLGGVIQELASWVRKEKAAFFTVFERSMSLIRMESMLMAQVERHPIGQAAGAGARLLHTSD